MGEIVNLGLQNYSHLSQRCELINVTQVPTNSGNAQVQLATFPKVKQKLNEKLGLIDESTWLQEGERFLDVQRAFNWIIYKVGMSDGMVRIEMRNVINSPLVPVRFPSYTEDDSSIIPFQTLEFTDLDGLQWVIILCNGLEGLKCWKFRNESNWTTNSGAYELSESDLGDLEQEEQTEANKLWQVFVQGFFYQYYKDLKDWDHNGTFSYPTSQKYDTLEQLMGIINKVNSELNLNDYTLVMTDDFKRCLVSETIQEISTGRWTTPVIGYPRGEMPIGGSWMNGLGMSKILMQTISDGQTRGTDEYLTNSDILKGMSDEWGISSNEAIGILAATASGAGLGTMIAPGWGTVIGGVIGLLVGTFAAIFSTYTSSRFYFSSITEVPPSRDEGEEDGANTAEGENLSENEKVTSNKLKGIISNIFYNIGKNNSTVVKFENNRNVTYLPTVWTDLTPGSLLPGKGDSNPDNAYNSFIILLSNLNALVDAVEKNTIQLKMRTWYVAFGEYYTRTITNFMRGWVLGDGSINLISRIYNSTTSLNHTWTWKSVPLSIKAIAQIMKQMLTTNYSTTDSKKIKDFADAIKDSITAFTTNPTNSPEYQLGELQALRQKISDSDFSDKFILMSLIDVISANIRQVNTRLNALVEECDKIINAENPDGTPMTYLEVSIVKDFRDFIRNATNHPIDDLGMTWGTGSVTEADTNTILIDYPQLQDNGNSIPSANILVPWLDAKEQIEKLRSMLILHRNDFEIYDIETLSHMLIIIAKDKDPNDGIEMESGRFYYSDAGTTNIQALNFYSAEYANSTPLEFWRLANRLVLFTNNTIEFWDITNNFEDPLSPAYSSNVYSLHVLQNSRVRFNDTLYFIAKPVELDNYSVYSLSKNGQLQQISYPQLDTWINKQIFTDLVRYNPLDTNWNYLVNGSIIDYEHVPIIQWHLNDRALNLNYNAMFNTFFLSDEMYFLENLCYFQLNSNIAGTLSNYFNKDKTAIEAIIRTVNTNFDPKKRYKTVAMFHGDVDLEDKRNFIDVSLCRSNNQVVKTVKSYWNKIFEPMGAINIEDYQTIRHKFYRVSNQPSESLRNVLLQPKQGERNVIYRVVGIGMGIDFQTEVRWNGFLRINNLAYEVE